jgi:glycosyltransferase involved in cell wall biosynthesis
MSKKKILIDLSILKNTHCGLGQVALNYGKYFKEQNSSDIEFEVYLLVPKQFVGAFGSSVKYITVNWWRKHFLSLIPRFDVWHAIHQLSHFRPTRKSTKYILTIHDVNFMYEKKVKKQKKLLTKLQNKVNRADQIVCISNFAKQDTERFIQLGNKQIKVILNGVEQLESKNAKTPNFINKEKEFFFTIGEIKKKKNFHVLLPLMKLFPEKELYIAGRTGGDYTEQIKSIIETEGITNVHLVGLVSNEERIWLYKNCKAFLFPSLFEGFGLPIIEAMTFGKAVFSSQETSLKEIGGNCAYFWNNFDAEHMKSVIDSNLQSFIEKPELSIRNINHAKSFSYAKHMKQYVDIYSKLINTK